MSVLVSVYGGGSTMKEETRLEFVLEASKLEGRGKGMWGARGGEVSVVGRCDLRDGWMTVVLCRWAEDGIRRSHRDIRLAAFSIFEIGGGRCVCEH